jgi:hypothetical protein
MNELAERDATGEIATIYDEIRRFCAVPYVSSMQRHLATRSGWLPWVWAALRPAFASGRAQEAAWRITAEVDLPRVEPVPRESLRAWGVDVAAEATIRAVCDSFIRVSPINLILSGLLRRLLAGERPGGDAPIRERAWTPPPALPSLPPLVAVDALPAAQRDTLLSLATMVDGRPFVPGLYRMLGHWPRFIAHVAGPLRPHLDAPATREAGQRLLEGLDGVIPALFATLPPLPKDPPVPPAAEFGGVLAALDAYRKTSPEMVVFSSLIRSTLPA